MMNESATTPKEKPQFFPLLFPAVHLFKLFHDLEMMQLLPLAPKVNKVSCIPFFINSSVDK